MGAIIGGITAPSTVDFYGHSALVFFFAGCNWRCPFCFNHEIIPMHGKHYSDAQLNKIVKQNKTCCDAVVLTGGEPTLQDQGCESIFRFARQYKMTTMLNTNGSQPMVIMDLVEKKLIDKIAMDIKAPIFVRDYQEMTGIKDDIVCETIKNTLNIINKLNVPLELRTTAIKDTYSFGKHLYRLIDQIVPYTSEWHLQQFDDENCFDQKLKGRVPSRDELLEYVNFAKRKGIKKVILKTKMNGYEEIKI